MDLHRAPSVPEWAAVPHARQNFWQRLASRTVGIVTIGNFFSIIGLLSVPYGLWLVGGEMYFAAAAVLAAGRLCDLADGWLANATATKSPLGEKIDASFDKVGTVWVIVGLMRLDVLSGITVALLMAPHAIIAALALAAFIQGKPFHPSLAGKFSMAALWATILAYVVAPALKGSAYSAAMFAAGVLLAIATLLGSAALYGYTGYTRELRRSRRGR